jgi:ethanolamine ammonia-lyase large subunit
MSLCVDDAVVFVNPTKADVDMVMQIMEHFDQATCLRTNTQKSTITPIRCSQVNLDQVLQNFAGVQVHFPIMYLGLPLCLSGLKNRIIRF